MSVNGNGGEASASLPELFRCAYCRCVVLPSDIERDGKCPDCGARRFQGVEVGLTKEEVERAQARGYVFDMTKWRHGEA